MPPQLFHRTAMMRGQLSGGIVTLRCSEVATISGSDFSEPELWLRTAAASSLREHHPACIHKTSIPLRNHSAAMKSIRFQQCGEPSSVLHCEEIAQPVPRPGEVLVRMLAAPVNPSDLMFIRGRYTTAAQLPASPGFEGTGIVVASGGGLRGLIFRGKRVAVLNRTGGNWSEFVTVPATQVIPISSALTNEQAATFFVNPATAWVMTQEVLRIPQGAWLAQSAAASSLGRMMIRLGKHCGFRTFNLVRRESQISELKALGADHVHVVRGDGHDSSSLSTEWRRVTGTDGIRYAVDPVGGATGSAMIECLGTGGHLLAYGTLSTEPLHFSPRTMMTVGSRLEGFWLGNFMAGLGLPAKLRLVRRITRLIRLNILSSEIRRTYSLSDVNEAVLAAEAPDSPGKILLTMNQK